MTQKNEFVLAGFLPYLLNRAAEDSSLEFSKIYKDRYGLLRTEWRVLFHLGQFGPMTASEISNRSKIHKTKISRAVTALQDRRLLDRTPRSDDRRSETLALTDKGAGVFAELAEIAGSYNAQLLEQFTAAEKAILMDCLRRLMD